MKVINQIFLVCLILSLASSQTVESIDTQQIYTYDLKEKNSNVLVNFDVDVHKDLQINLWGYTGFPDFELEISFNHKEFEKKNKFNGAANPLQSINVLSYTPQELQEQCGQEQQCYVQFKITRVYITNQWGQGQIRFQALQGLNNEWDPIELFDNNEYISQFFSLGENTFKFQLEIQNPQSQNISTPRILNLQQEFFNGRPYLESFKFGFASKLIPQDGEELHEYPTVSDEQLQYVPQQYLGLQNCDELTCTYYITLRIKQVEDTQHYWLFSFLLQVVDVNTIPQVSQRPIDVQASKTRLQVLKLDTAQYSSLSLLLDYFQKQESNDVYSYYEFQFFTIYSLNNKGQYTLQVKNQIGDREVSVENPSGQYIIFAYIWNFLTPLAENEYQYKFIVLDNADSTKLTDNSVKYIIDQQRLFNYEITKQTTKELAIAIVPSGDSISETNTSPFELDQLQLRVKFYRNSTEPNQWYPSNQDFVYDSNIYLDNMGESDLFLWKISESMRQDIYENACFEIGCQVLINIGVQNKAEFTFTLTAQEGNKDTNIAPQTHTILPHVLNKAFILNKQQINTFKYVITDQSNPLFINLQVPFLSQNFKYQLKAIEKNVVVLEGNTKNIKNQNSFNILSTLNDDQKFSKFCETGAGKNCTLSLEVQLLEQQNTMTLKKRPEIQIQYLVQNGFQDNTNNLQKKIPVYGFNFLPTYHSSDFSGIVNNGFQLYGISQNIVKDGKHFQKYTYKFNMMLIENFSVNIIISEKFKNTKKLFLQAESSDGKDRNYVPNMELKEDMDWQSYKSVPFYNVDSSVSTNYVVAIYVYDSDPTSESSDYSTFNIEVQPLISVDSQKLYQMNKFQNRYSYFLLQNPQENELYNQLNIMPKNGQKAFYEIQELTLNDGEDGELEYQIIEQENDLYEIEDKLSQQYLAIGYQKQVVANVFVEPSENTEDGEQSLQFLANSSVGTVQELESVFGVSGQFILDQQKYKKVLILPFDKYSDIALKELTIRISPSIIIGKTKDKNIFYANFETFPTPKLGQGIRFSNKPIYFTSIKNEDGSVDLQIPAQKCEEQSCSLVIQISFPSYWDLQPMFGVQPATISLQSFQQASQNAFQQMESIQIPINSNFPTFTYKTKLDIKNLVDTLVLQGQALSQNATYIDIIFNNDTSHSISQQLIQPDQDKINKFTAIQIAQFDKETLQQDQYCGNVDVCDIQFNFRTSQKNQTNKLEQANYNQQEKYFQNKISVQPQQAQEGVGATIKLNRVKLDNGQYQYAETQLTSDTINQAFDIQSISLFYYSVKATKGDNLVVLLRDSLSTQTAYTIVSKLQPSDATDRVFPTPSADSYPDKYHHQYKYLGKCEEDSCEFLVTVGAKKSGEPNEILTGQSFYVKLTYLNRIETSFTNEAAIYDNFNTISYENNNVFGIQYIKTSNETQNIYYKQQESISKGQKGFFLSPTYVTYINEDKSIAQVMKQSNNFQALIRNLNQKNLLTFFYPNLYNTHINGYTSQISNDQIVETLKNNGDSNTLQFNSIQPQFFQYPVTSQKDLQIYLKNNNNVAQNPDGNIQIQATFAYDNTPYTIFGYSKILSSLAQDKKNEGYYEYKLGDFNSLQCTEQSTCSVFIKISPYINSQYSAYVGQINNDKGGKGGSKSWIIGLVITLVLLVACGVGVIIYKKKNSNKKSDDYQNIEGVETTNGETRA